MPLFTATVSEVVKATPTVGIVRLSFGNGVPFSFRPGQYMFVHMDIKGEKHIKPYSIASPPSEKNFIEFCIKQVPEGPMSNYMVSLKGKESVQLQGPAGVFALQERVENDIIFAATGTGISSIRPMIETIFEKGTKHTIFLFFGAKTADEIVYKKQFEALAKKHKNFRFIPIVSRDPGFKGEQGHVQDIILKYVKDIKEKDIYICGVQAMVEETIKWAQENGFPKEKIHFEKYL